MFRVWSVFEDYGDGNVVLKKDFISHKDARACIFASKKKNLFIRDHLVRKARFLPKTRENIYYA